MARKFSQVDEVSEATIAVHWQEEGYYRPSVEFIAQANLTDPDVHKRFGLENFPECFKEYADLLTWYKYWERTLDTSGTRRSGNGSWAVR